MLARVLAPVHVLPPACSLARRFAALSQVSMGGPDAKRVRLDTSGKAHPALRALYVTGNEGKHQEAQHIVSLLRGNRVHLERVDLDLPELQGSPKEISVAKTEQAAQQLEDKFPDVRFIITDDGGLEFSCLNGFPGVYIKPMLQHILDTGLAELVHRYEDHRATATCTLGIFDRQTGSISHFSGALAGEIIKKPRGNVKHGKVSWNTVFVPVGEERTFGEMPMEEHAVMSHRQKAFSSWLDAVLPTEDA